MVTYSKRDREEAVLTEEAEGIAANGSHEAKVFEAVRKAVEGLKISDLPVRGSNCMPARLDVYFSVKLTLWQALVGKESAKVGQGKAMKERWIVKEKDTLKANVGALRLHRFMNGHWWCLDGYHNRHKSRTAADHPTNTLASRPQSLEWFEEEEADHHAKGLGFWD